ncbi:MAG: electron transport complex subunit E, partial [Ruminococcus sp.]|nr:electron transport complex subunit E [Ruminococcus sp.]
GTFFGIDIPVLVDNKIAILTMAPGGFFVFGLLIAIVNKFGKHKPQKKEFGCAGCPQAAACGRADCGGCGEEKAEVAAK